MKSILRNLIMTIFVSVFFQGCFVADFFTLGESKTICEEEGCDYKDAGVCMNPYEILTNKEISKTESYKKYDKKRTFSDK